MGLFGICIHKWESLGGAMNIGNGKFKKRFKCVKCGKIKEEIR